jgi:hypothetical protein
MNNIFGGGGSTDTSSGSPIDLTGGSSDPFGGTGGSDLGTLFSSIGQAFAGGGAGGGSPAATVDAIQNATDPTGSIAAQTAITGGQGGANAPQPTQTQNPQGPQGGGGGGQDQFAPPSAVDALKKALTGLRQQQRQNPYAFPNSNSPMLNRAGRIPTDQVPNAPAEPDDPNAPSQFASAMEFSNDNPPPPQPNTIDPADAVRAGLRSNAPDTSGQFKIPGAANENAPSENFPAYLKNLREGGGAAPAPAPEVPPQTPPSPLPTGGGGGGGILGTLAGLAPGSLGELAARMGGPLGVFLGSTSPAETGEMPQQTLGRSPSGPAPTPELPKSEVLREGEGGPATTTAPVTGKKVETVDPKTKKPVDAKTGQPLPTKTGKLPTKKGPQETPTGMDQRVGPIMRDISGVSHGVPLPLGQLAQMAMPLLMMAMSGGFGGGGRHGGHGRGFGGMGHPGGRGMWPYHHPNFGWGMHGFHPGGGWRPMHPVHFREMGGGGGGSNPLQQMMAMQALAGGGQQGGSGDRQQPQGGGGGDQGFNPALATNTPTSGQIPGMSASDVDGLVRQAATDNGIDPNVLSRLVSAESAYGQNYTNPRDTNGYPSYGPFQLNMAPGAMGDQFMRETGKDPKDPRTVPDQIKWVAQQIPKTGWKPWATSAGKLGMGDWAGINRDFKPGTTVTGGDKKPNPEGNPSPVITTQQDPEAVASAS